MSAERQRRNVRPLLLLAWAVVIGLTIALAIDIVRVGGPAAWVTQRFGPDPISGPAYERLGTMVDVDGRGVYLDCRGNGSPTVILESGLGSGADGWGELFDGIAAFTRVCASDRPGLGQSEGIGRHSAMTTSERLHAALEAYGERGPYVVVAHSFGGVYARLFAAADPGVVESLVMLDTYEPDLGMDADPALSDATRAFIRQNLDEGGRTFEAVEGLDWAATLAELARADPASLDVLLLYTDPVGRYLDPDPATREAMIAAWYRAIATRYPSGELEIVPTGHFVHLDRPDLVSDRVREIVDHIRSR